MIEDKKITLIRDLKMVEDLIGHCYYGTNCLIHVGRIVDLAINGYYHIGYIAQNEENKTTFGSIPDKEPFRREE